MNYRHAFHAGNFADVMKHALLTRLLSYLAKKDKPFRVIDTHSGVGLYALDGDEASRTGEWLEGVAKLEQPFPPAVEELLVDYRRILADVKARYGETIYPGSPAITREMLRRQDRAILVELHPVDAEELKARYNSVSNIKVMHLDGWTALQSLIPPKENRGLVLIDPPFEKTDEFQRITREVVKAVHKWSNGVYAIWYPIKDQRQITRWADDLGQQLVRPALRLELMIDSGVDITRLNGCGLIVINPPWTLKAEAEVLLPALVERLGLNKKASCVIEELGPAQ
ncbi:23S rRNA (adenine(2030)-N(6))-methyltransferase RlmJ [Microvirga sp. W0021]|uniref:Ribosomal RNA large subunit methyltransferase J n=1 Tax=Hohaiivirga grylli TaxID=3133970 RepID=A0ABV0BKF3_9HYPH